MLRIGFRARHSLCRLCNFSLFKPNRPKGKGRFYRRKVCERMKFILRCCWHRKTFLLHVDGHPCCCRRLYCVLAVDGLPADRLPVGRLVEIKNIFSHSVASKTFPSAVYNSTKLLTSRISESVRKNPNDIILESVYFEVKVWSYLKEIR